MIGPPHLNDLSFENIIICILKCHVLRIYKLLHNEEAGELTKMSSIGVFVFANTG